MDFKADTVQTAAAAPKSADPDVIKLESEDFNFSKKLELFELKKVIKCGAEEAKLSVDELVKVFEPSEDKGVKLIY